MSLSLEFEPHSWYMGFAIRDCRAEIIEATGEKAGTWNAITDDGNTYRIIDIEAGTLAELKQLIREYHTKAGNGYGERLAARNKNTMKNDNELISERAARHAQTLTQGVAQYTGGYHWSEADQEAYEIALAFFTNHGEYLKKHITREG